MITIKGKFIKGPNVVMNGLVLYLDAANTKSYPGSGTVWTDLMNNKYIANLTNGPTFTNSNGGIVTLDGTNDYIYINHSGNLSFTSGNYTISVWNRDNVNPVSSYGGIITNDEASDSAWKIFKDVGDAFYKARSYITTVRFSNYVVNRWHMYSYTFNAGNVITYLDGVATGYTASGASNPLSWNNIAYGSYRYNDAVNGNYLHNQSIGPTMLYNRALTAAEVLQNFNAMRSRFGV